MPRWEIGTADLDRLLQDVDGDQLDDVAERLNELQDEIENMVGQPVELIVRVLRKRRGPRHARGIQT